MKIRFKNAEVTAEILRLALRALSGNAAHHAGVATLLSAMRGGQSPMTRITYLSEIEVDWEEIAPLMDARVSWEVAAFRAMELEHMTLPTEGHIASGKNCAIGFGVIKLEIFGESLADD